MFSGTTLTPLKYFDAWFGAHQKLDRTARRHVKLLGAAKASFPSTGQILKFEGLNGPDGIKRKAPAQDEPWHYFDPYDPKDIKLLGLLEYHYEELVLALREGNQTRAAFEAAWLAHGIVDGLTPAHHYPYEEELIKLRGGEGIETRTTIKEKLVMHGDTVAEKVGNNWKMWGEQGLLFTHFAFEWGVAVMIVPLRLKLGIPDDAELKAFQTNGFAKTFRDRALHIADLNMYETFYQSGWTPKLAKQVRRDLAPGIVNMITLAWHNALLESQTTKSR